MLVKTLGREVKARWVRACVRVLGGVSLLMSLSLLVGKASDLLSKYSSKVFYTLATNTLEQTLSLLRRLKII